METSKQPVKEVPPQPRHSSSPPVPSSAYGPAASSVRHTGSMQHVQVASSVVTSFNLLKPPERDQSLFSQMKSIKSLKYAGITAVFTGQTKVDHDQDNEEVVPFREVILADIDSLVPTHDEAGCPIAEWKRQVMVRQLQVQLTHDDEQHIQDVDNGYPLLDGWKYSQTHRAVLGPFGELLTEEDLVYLHRQIESVSIQKRCQVYELELARLAQELRAILPDPLVNITINTDILRQMDAEERLPLPAWCSRVSDMIRNMSLLLGKLTSGDEDGEKSALEGMVEGVKESARVRDCLGLELSVEETARQQSLGKATREEISSVCRIPHIGMASAFSHRLESNSCSRAHRERVEREIAQSGVSVRTLRSNFEGQIGAIYPFGGFVSSAQQQEVKQGEGVRTVVVTGCPDTRSQTGMPSCEPNLSNVSKQALPVVETTSLRKERIVVLFLSHWKKSAYAITTRAARLKQAQEVAATADGKAVNNLSSLQAQQNSPSMLHFCHQRLGVSRMLHSWRTTKPDLGGLAAPCPAPCSSPSQALCPQLPYSPEQFLPQVNGMVASYDTLTLDQFMLGYFHILEQQLPADERKMRHLLCFEVFDHVGSYPWETVRDFHRAVLQEIQAGKRQWNNGFDDIKARFFGVSTSTSVPGRCHGGGTIVNPSAPSSVSLLSPDARQVPKVIVQTASQDEGGSDTDFSCFSNEDICQYVDRSFAFWKEKEAELFDFDR